MPKSKEGLVTVAIPTYNSERTLARCIESVRNQTYNNIEILVIDSNSKDRTQEIAKSLGASVYQYEGTLLGAREVGAKEAKGRYILLLDSDQILEQTTIERGVNLLKDYDMLWLEERTYNPTSILEKLYDADRKFVQKYSNDFLNPVGGVILPRFYKTDLIRKAFEKIPREILPLCVAHDHAIIYYEAKKISDKITKLDNAVWHQEPSSFLNLFKKTYRYGKTTKSLVRNDVYLDIIKSKNSMRKFEKGDLKLWILSNILRVIRGIPYKLGYWFG